MIIGGSRMIVPLPIGSVHKKYQNSLLMKKNVIGMGYGLKSTSGLETKEECLVVFVREKEPVANLVRKDLVPSDLDGVTIDVKEIGHVVIHKSRTDRWRPAPGGVSIGHYTITAGTFGAIVRDASTGETLILSNNHVLANSNDSAKGDAILQPGPVDGGQNPQDRIASLERYVRIEYSTSDGDEGGNGTCSIAKTVSEVLNSFAKLKGSSHRLSTYRVTQTGNLVDAAVAKPVDGSAISNEIIDIGAITGVKTAQIGMSVRKSGRTTGTTVGTIQSLNATLQVGYGGNRVALFENQILTSNMSQPGDSGSLLVDGTENKAVGLLFAGSDEVTVHCPIETVMQLLNITF